MTITATKIKNWIFYILLYSFMVIFAIITIYPFLHIFAISLNEFTDTMRGGIHIWPRKFTLLNYKTIFNYGTLPMAIFISILRTVIGTLTGVFCTTMLSYTLIQKHFILKKLTSIMLLITLYVSGGLIPDFFLIRNLGLMNNFLVYILPGLIWAWNVIVIRAYMEGIPESLSESAKIDGANDFTIFFRIIFPLCAPVTATIALFVAVGHWNSWLDTYLYCTGIGARWLSTLQYRLMEILTNVEALSDINIYRTDAGRLKMLVNPQSIRAAITIVATVPILMVYPFVQKYFVKGIKLGAVKE